VVFSCQDIIIMNMRFLIHICTSLLLAVWFITGCSSDNSKHSKLFVEVLSRKSGIHFENILAENDSMNYWNYMDMYMGGGVAIGDFNNDGLADIYFTGNMVENKLYLNKGDLKFEDITQHANVGADDRWMTGVTLGDANQDGWLDIYICASGIWATTKDLLYINDAKEGEIPTFTESAQSYGVADEGNNVHAVFFDYDLDGDQDLYVINYPIVPSRRSITEYLAYRDNAPKNRSDRLYRNNGDNSFSDVTIQAGLAKYGLSLSVLVGDYNQDGWPDMYVSNDFSTPDYFFINNKDGSFSNEYLNLTNHSAYFGMGSDVGDFNNDGYLDIFQLDMKYINHRRQNENMDRMKPGRFKNMIDHDMHYQYTQNILQLFMGLDSTGLPHFGDIGNLAGVTATDWSWGPLLADFDNDGFKDIYISNGTKRDVNNSDFFRSDIVKNFEHKEPLELTKQIPSEKIKNFAFKNKGDLTFLDVSNEWGIDYEGFTNGSAYADLDNDGDLDLVVNNLEDKSKLYENKANILSTNTYIRVQLGGHDKNAFGIGCKVWLEDHGELQYQELTLSRGFQSSVEPIVHFGTGEKEEIEKIKVLWQDGKEQVLNQVKTNQLLKLDYRNAIYPQTEEVEAEEQVFKDITRQAGVQYKHEENPFDDYRYQVALPYKTSQYGPALAVADIDNDGLDDFYIGGAYQSSAKMFRQNNDGTFSEILSDLWETDKISEDVSAAFFDANNDGLVDLYVVCGGNESRKGDSYYQDKFYLNKGDGVFKKDITVLPKMTESGSVVVPADYDNDGDLDLFVGGRMIPRNYPMAPKSSILQNISSTDSIRFVDVTKEVAPDLLNLGMVTQALWNDVDNDKHTDLIIIGEWMGITYLKNNKGKFVNESKSAGLLDKNGWWLGLVSHDFDSDGDPDFILGNLGRNYNYQASEDDPFNLYTYDFDNNGKNDIVFSTYEEGIEIPVDCRDGSAEQIPAIKIKFQDFHSYATASLADIYSEEHLEQATHYQIRSFAHSYLENLGNGQFKLLPIEDNFMQIAPLNTMVVHDINGDGNEDVIYAGNLYGSKVEIPRADASFGGVLTGNGNGGFKSVMPYDSGLLVKGEVKNIRKIELADGSQGVLFAVNNDYLKLFRIINPGEIPDI